MHYKDNLVIGFSVLVSPHEWANNDPDERRRVVVRRVEAALLEQQAEFSKPFDEAFGETPAPDLTQP